MSRLSVLAVFVAVLAVVYANSGNIPRPGSISTNFDANHGDSGNTGNGKRNAAHYAHAYHKRQAGKPLPRMQRQVKCDSTYPYRRADGTCNNLEHPTWGSVGQPYQRMLSPVYDDGANLPRLRSVTGDYLPSSRTVSVNLHNYDHPRPHEKGNVLLMEWGQFLAHDIVRTPVVNDSVKCCYDELVTGGALHPDVKSGGPCFPIIISEGDRQFTTTSSRCMEFVRSYNVTNSQGHREQVNILSSYIDGTNIYGYTDEEMATLRTDCGTGAKLRTFPGTSNLPESSDNVCIKGDDYCMESGDSRVNAYPALGALHTIFARFHNYLVDQLHEQHPHYNNETLFQEARKLNVAVLQSISYNEYLPNILGSEFIAAHGIDSMWAYNNTCDATLYNVFATAAFRFGHSMIPDTLFINGQEIPSIDLFSRPSYVLHYLDSLIEGLVTRSAEKGDRWYSLGMTDHMFETAEQNGFDIASRNIQRGRDHGIPPYNEWREFCGLPRLNNLDEMDFPLTFKAVYSDINDVDLYTGALSNDVIPTAGASVSAINACLLGKQFANLRKCDRFFYENPDHFNAVQVQSIRKMKLSDVICLTTGITNIQDKALLTADDTNPTEPCNDLLSRSLDISKF